jgi:hypothetical protein
MTQRKWRREAARQSWRRTDLIGADGEPVKDDWVS